MVENKIDCTTPRELTPQEKLTEIMGVIDDEVKELSFRGEQEQYGEMAGRIEKVLQGEEPDTATEERIAILHRVIKPLSLVDHPDVINAWLKGQNTNLDDHSPILMMLTDPKKVEKAAEDYIANG